jgi:hypothetical protein
MNELFHGFDVELTLESGASVQAEFDPGMQELLGKFVGTVSIRNEGE